MDLKEENPVKEENLSTDNNSVMNSASNEEKVIDNNIEKTVDNNASNEKYKNKKTSTIKKILKPISLTINITTWVLVIFLLAILIITVLSRKTDVFGHRIYLVVTGSMEPQIHMKDAVITKQEDNLNEGDTIAFEQGEAVTIHRIVKIYTEGENRLYQTKGDANNIIDKGLVQKNQVKGKVIATSTVMGNCIYWLQHNFIIFILVIGLLLVILIIRRLI